MSGGKVRDVRPSASSFKRIDQSNTHIRKIADVPAYQNQFSVDCCCGDPGVAVGFGVGDVEADADQRYKDNGGCPSRIAPCGPNAKSLSRITINRRTSHGARLDETVG
jgi:hypothetical protein